MSTQRAVLIILLIAAALLAAGTYIFATYEGVSYGEAFYDSLLIMLRHFSHNDLDSTPSRVFNIILILSSIALVGYLLKVAAEYMIGLGDSLRKRTMARHVSKLKDHYIVCGLGRVGSQVAREMALEEVPFVAVDRDPKKVEEAIQLGYVAQVADSTSEEVLADLGIDRAKGLVAGLGEDSVNLLVTLAARAMNPDLYIVARANRAENELKLKRAGANRVALPYQIGGYHMASMALRPSVVDYFDIVGSSGNTSDLQVEEMIVADGSKLAGHRLGKGLTEGEVGATVIAINGSDGTSRVRPTGNETIYPGDRLIVLGSKHELTKASELIT